MDADLCVTTDHLERLREAAAFLTAAEMDEALDDAQHVRGAVVTMSVHAGLAAADALCCSRLGVHVRGEDPGDAVRRLRAAIGTDARLLRVLVSLGRKAAEGRIPVSRADVILAARAARSLVDLAAAG